MKPKDLNKMMAQARKMQTDMMNVQNELAEMRIEGASGEGKVKATVSGQGELVEICISPEVVDPDDVEILEDLILVAIHNAVEHSKDASKGKMDSLKIPGLEGLL